MKSNDEWPDAEFWASKPTFPFYFIGSIYGGVATFGIIWMIIHGRWREIFNTAGLIVNGWALFAVLLSWYVISTIRRARRHVSAR